MANPAIAKKAGKNALVKYLKDVRAEMRKVTWPTKKVLIQYTGIVLLACFIVGTILGVADVGLSKLLEIISV